MLLSWDITREVHHVDAAVHSCRPECFMQLLLCRLWIVPMGSRLCGRIVSVGSRIIGAVGAGLLLLLLLLSRIELSLRHDGVPASRHVERRVGDSVHPSIRGSPNQDVLAHIGLVVRAVRLSRLLQVGRGGQVVQVGWSNWNGHVAEFLDQLNE